MEIIDTVSCNFVLLIMKEFWESWSIFNGFLVGWACISPEIED